MTSTDFKMVKGHDPFVLATILHPSIKPIIDSSLFKDHQTLKHKLLLHVQIGSILQICTCIQLNALFYIVQPDTFEWGGVKHMLLC